MSCAASESNLSRNTSMALIKGRKLAHDNWKLLEAAGDGAALTLPPSGDVIVPLSLWRELRADLAARDGRLGVWLAGNDEPADIAGDLHRPHPDAGALPDLP